MTATTTSTLVALTVHDGPPGHDPLGCEAWSHPMRACLNPPVSVLQVEHRGAYWPPVTLCDEHRVGSGGAK